MEREAVGFKSLWSFPNDCTHTKKRCSNQMQEGFSRWTSDKKKKNVRSLVLERSPSVVWLTGGGAERRSPLRDKGSAVSLSHSHLRACWAHMKRKMSCLVQLMFWIQVTLKKNNNHQRYIVMKLKQKATKGQFQYSARFCCTTTDVV